MIVLDSATPIQASSCHDWVACEPAAWVQDRKKIWEPLLPKRLLA
jgi:hypothetical protein